MTYTLFIKVAATAPFVSESELTGPFRWQGTPPHAERRELLELFREYGPVERLSCGDKDFIFVVCPWRNFECHF
jgi:hypothetical protein